VYKDEVESLTAPTEAGEVTILLNHIPLVANLRPGEMVARSAKGEVYLSVSTGFLEVRKGNRIVILADTAERVEELDLAKIEAAREAARKLVEEKRHMNDASFAAAASALERELAREKLVRKRRRNIYAHP
jgi:F-type H+-transporting ATPase subunit epsilon